jgi:hypothetical protein
MAAALAAHHGVHLDPSAHPPDAPRHARPREGKPQAWRPLGRILVERNLLTESGLQRCLLTQKRKGGSLGEILLGRGYVTPAQLADALAEQQGLAIDRKVLDEAKPLPVNDEAETRYEVRTPGDRLAEPIFSSSSYLDATDFAFELLGTHDPDELEIVRIAGREPEQVWSYSRDAAEAFRAENEDRYRTFQPLVQHEDGTPPVVIRLRSSIDD